MFWRGTSFSGHITPTTPSHGVVLRLKQVTPLKKVSTGWWSKLDLACVKAGSSRRSRWQRAPTLHLILLTPSLPDQK